MGSTRWRGLLGCALAPGLGLLAVVMTSAQARGRWEGVLDEHPAIQYASRPTTERVAKLNEALARGARTLQRETRTGYLRPVLDALDISPESQLLVFSKTGVQRAYTNPHTPRALYFNESVVVGYIADAPLIEVAAHDRQQGVIFYTLDQRTESPALMRRTSCLTCHVTASTLYVPGMIVRSNAVDEDGRPRRQFGASEVTHRTPHPDRWGGWFVTTPTSAARYTQRAHAGNITVSAGGVTSNQVFVDWLDSAPEKRGYLASSSDLAALLVFDHQMHAMNLLTQLNWESRVATANEHDPAVARLAGDVAEYFLFAGEAPPSVPVTPPAGFAAHLESATPKDRRGRSFGQLDLVRRLLRYPCSYMIYAEAFDGLSPAVKQAVYRRMIAILAGHDPSSAGIRLSAEERQAVIEILRDTKPDFPPN